ncbi:MAG: VapC toxin family PIN domain ribonuclease [Desulfobacteraceae bacterium 4572_130]|nr:MAG: VapC toxin family PIN domain ribonuclease [Desulfobacteraceae bacterium 4572_130]
MGLMLDTNVFIYSERSNKPIDFSKYESYGDVYISSITVSELLVGVHYANNDAKKARRSAFVESVLAKIPVLSFNTKEARVHAGLFSTLTKQGQIIGAHDLIIAATAIVHNCAVLTENIKEFKRISGLETISFIRF